ncbi:MAG: PIG-L family deacetylase [Acidobacteriota bacterium]|nr:MAG: PIG-L family deacetylase [Acidobacteriota bacterium]
MKRVIIISLSLLICVQIALFSVTADTRPVAEDRGASGLAMALRRLQTIASMLHTAAHPDDESTELLAYVARAQGARVAYLSLNRGEGGQNGIGPELGEALGVIRTEELLAARKLDGAEQYFTRAYDFGFTLSPEETLEKWNREEVLGDMVRVIRMMRPLVVVGGFSGTSRDGHGQHQVAGMLTPEAIKAAADPSRFPEQISREGLQPWRVLKVYGRIFGQCQGNCAEFDVGTYDPVAGRSYAELAADGRSRHRSQDFGMIQARGSQIRSFPRWESTVEVPAKEASLFTGIDITVTGIAAFAGPEGAALKPALQKIQDLASAALREFRVEQPAAIAPHLASGLRQVRHLRAGLNVRDPVSRATVDGMLARKEREFSDALIRAHGVVVDALSNAEIVTPGESVDIRTNVYIGSSRRRSDPDLDKKLEPSLQLTVPGGWRIEPGPAEEEPPAGQMAFLRSREKPDIISSYRVTAPRDEPPTQPYWLARPRTREQFDWNENMPRNLPFAPPPVVAQVALTLDGERVVINQPVEYRFADKTFGEIRRGLKVAPALTLTVNPSLLVIPSGSRDRTREISFEIINNARRPTAGSVKLLAPQGWKVVSDDRPLAFTGQNEKTSRTFRITPPAGANGTFDIKAVAESEGSSFSTGYSVISYPHIEKHLIYHPSITKVEVFDVNVAADLKVGYIMGSGDDGPRALAQMGVDVRMIAPDELVSGDLSIYDTIILGIRVYEVNEHVIANNKRLLDYVAAGGTLIVQYNKTEFERGNFAPYPIKMGRGLRITNEYAPVKILVPDHPLFNFPNKITEEDWKGWVQERGLYFLNDWDSRYTALLEAPNESGTPLRGGQLIAQYGKGTYIFTGYSWFRQFPAGVPGAYRLFANMVSLPKYR